MLLAWVGRRHPWLLGLILVPITLMLVARIISSPQGAALLVMLVGGVLCVWLIARASRSAEDEIGRAIRGGPVRAPRHEIERRV